MDRSRFFSLVPRTQYAYTTIQRTSSVLERGQGLLRRPMYAFDFIRAAQTVRQRACEKLQRPIAVPSSPFSERRRPWPCGSLGSITEDGVGLRSTAQPITIEGGMNSGPGAQCGRAEWRQPISGTAVNSAFSIFQRSGKWATGDRNSKIAHCDTVAPNNPQPRTHILPH